MKGRWPASVKLKKNSNEVHPSERALGVKQDYKISLVARGF